MVSTRNNKYKFSDGEKVLCYEPDRKKAKVLYDSKVLEVKTRKDTRGRTIVEYLIHFKGWNSSWDRCVSEAYVLKDTEKNRKLQRQLADKAELQQKAYLYRSDQKKKKPTTLSERVVEPETICLKQERSSVEEQEYSTATDDEKETVTYDSDESEDQRFPLDVSFNLLLHLEEDHALINLENKLMKVPCTPNVIEILEGYVRYSSNCFHESEGGKKPRSRINTNPPLDKTQELHWICAQINLCKEVVEGLRICFDHYLGKNLLYAAELAQFHELQSEEKECLPIAKTEISPEDEVARLPENNKVDEPCLSVDDAVASQLPSETKDVERRRSLRSHKDVTNEPCTSNGVSKLTVRNLGTLGEHSHCSAQSSSSTSSSYGPLNAANPQQAQGAGQLTAEIDQLVTLASAWRLVPESYLNEQPPPPSTLYGAIHLARLLVKLPTILYDAFLPEKENQPRWLSVDKQQLLLHHLQALIEYIESQHEWFNANHYMSKSTPAVV